MIKSFSTIVSTPKGSGSKSSGNGFGTVLLVVGVAAALYFGYKYIKNQNPVQIAKEDE